MDDERSTQTQQYTTLHDVPAAKVISASQFATLHTAHLLAHPPDGVLFPFLHGLEGDNHAQNTFFAATAPKGPPKFRGLVWVVAEEEMELEGANMVDDGEGYSDDGFSDEESEEDELIDMDIDSSVQIVDGDHPPVQTLEEVPATNDDNAKHMHPVHHRGDPLGNSTSEPPMEIALPPPTSLIPPPMTPSTDSSTPSQYSAHSPPSSIEDSGIDPLNPPFLTCTFHPRELIRPVERPPLTHSTPLAAVKNASANPNTNGAAEETEEWEFRPARVPDGISLRNFGIQVPIYATLSDIVVYSPKGLSGSRMLVPLAKRFATAIQRKRAERLRKLGLNGDEDEAPLEYNVYVLDADSRELKKEVPELMMRVFESSEAKTRSRLLDGMQIDSSSGEPDAPVAVPLRAHTRAETAPNTVDFGQRERDEMRELTKASEILTVRRRSRTRAATSGSDSDDEEDLSTTTTASHWRPTLGQVFLGNSGDVPLSLPLQAHPSDQVPDPQDPFNYLPTNPPAAGMGYDICVECHEMAPFPSVAHLRAAEEHIGMLESMWAEKMRLEGDIKRVRPPPNANTVIHLPFPSSPPNTTQSMNAMLPVLAFLEKCLRPLEEPESHANGVPNGNSHGRRWSTSPAPPSSTFFSSAPSPIPSPPPGATPRTRSLTSPTPQPPTLPAPRSRPLKVLVYSSDGYTESSPLALSLIMASKHLSLPEAYLELQVTKRRSFFVYPGEVGMLRKVEARMKSGEREKEQFEPHVAANGIMRRASTAAESRNAPAIIAPTPKSPSPQPNGRPPAKSVSFAAMPVSASVPNTLSHPPTSQPRSGRPRARTSPWLPSFGDHQSWFNDPRFDGSFPSRVLPFLYLGNLNHATNAYMLHALGITHVVSVGECALIPPPGHCNAPTADMCDSGSCRAHNGHFIAGKGPGNQGSLWMEERAGRIKVLDIKGVCDDGIDTLEPQLAPICDWIEKARLEGGQVLVHCRVGVSRSATVTIAYVMKHLELPLVDAYLIVRSRRLSVLIQPNMRLMWNLCGWEVELAKERARRAGAAADADGDAEQKRLRKELARTLTWPFLAKEVHALNEKYLH